ncbi:uncharacterized protein ARMOST_04654 [Armillaria ostoyae]|uniref:Uncharacterized protein n=1 Tax=Armillaria ostoyae TaxID=47428 RepID=A0A284QXZ0_ARMOS|nr:uncharacterized protein ARMOST_04654 [Armillaria ostoyae]
MDDLLSQGFQHLPWPGDEPQPILDTIGACIMVLGGHPNNPRWDILQCEACDDIEKAAS